MKIFLLFMTSCLFTRYRVKSIPTDMTETSFNDTHTEFFNSIKEVTKPDTIFYKFDRLAYITEGYRNIKIAVNITNYYIIIDKIIEEQPALNIISTYVRDPQCSDESFALSQLLRPLITQRDIIKTLENEYNENNISKRETRNDRAFTQELILLFDEQYREVRANLEMLETRIMRVEHNIRLFKEKQKINDLLYTLTYLKFKIKECYFKGQAIHNVLTGKTRSVIELISEKTLINELAKIINNFDLDKQKSESSPKEVIPLKPNVYSLMYLLESTHTSTMLRKNMLHIKVKIPIVQDKLYRSAEAVPVPFLIINETGVIKPQFRFGLIEADLSSVPLKAYSLTENERHSCEMLPNKILLCQPLQESKNYSHVGDLQEVFVPGCVLSDLIAKRQRTRDESNYFFCRYEKHSHTNTIVRIPQLDTNTYYTYIINPMNIIMNCGKYKARHQFTKTSTFTVEDNCHFETSPKVLREERANYTMLYENEISLTRFTVPRLNETKDYSPISEDNISLLAFKLTHNYTDKLEKVSNSAVQLSNPYKTKPVTEDSEVDFKRVVIIFTLILGFMLIVAIMVMLFLFIRESKRRHSQLCNSISLTDKHMDD